MKKIKFPAALAGATMFIFLFFFAREFAEGLVQGLESCAKTVIPSLFPFLIAASLAGGGTLPEKAKKIISPITERLFRLPADTLPVIVPAQLGGYLSGAKAAESLLHTGVITKLQAQRLMLFSVNAGMGFSVNALDGIMLGSREAGRLVFISLCIFSIVHRIVRVETADGTADIFHHYNMFFSFFQGVPQSEQQNSQNIYHFVTLH